MGFITRVPEAKQHSEGSEGDDDDPKQPIRNRNSGV